MKLTAVVYNMSRSSSARLPLLRRMVRSIDSFYSPSRRVCPQPHQTILTQSARMLEIKMFKLVFRIILFFGLVIYAAASPLQLDIRRESDFTTTVTTWAAPNTVTVNPSDPTVWRPVYTRTIWPFTTTVVITSGCVTYTGIYPPEDPTGLSTTKPASTSTSLTTATITVTTRSTVTETRTDRPITTKYSVTTPTVSKLTGRTDYSTKCTNTLVRSFYVPTIHTYTYTTASVYTRIFKTEVCMTSVTRWATIPGVTLTYEPYTADWDRFTTGTIVTTPEPLWSSTQVTVTTDTAIETEVVCDNPGTRTTSTYYTVTMTPSTSTVYRQRADCSSSSIQPPAATPTAPPVLAGRGSLHEDAQEGRVKTMIVAEPVLVVRQGSYLQDSGVKLPRQAPPVITPVEVQTITYTTAVLLNGTVTTLTGTAVVDVYTRTFTTIAMVGHTVTATATIYSSVCSVPTAEAVAPPSL
jgi:hypothetical protein